VGSVFDVTGGVTACPVTAALPPIGVVRAAEWWFCRRLGDQC